MKLVKLYTREYTLFERDITCRSLISGSASLPEVFYTYAVNISKEGVVDIYTKESDAEDNKRRVLTEIRKDSTYLERKLHEGVRAVQGLGEVDKDLPNRIAAMSDPEIKHEVLSLYGKLVAFSSYFDFTHVVGNSGIALTDTQTKALGDFHEIRKATFMGYFKFFGAVCAAIARKKNMAGNLSGLTFPELEQLLDGTLSVPEADNLETTRGGTYIYVISKDGYEIITPGDKFDELEKQVSKQVGLHEDVSEIRGTSVFKGIVKGVVHMVSQKVDLSSVPEDKIIVSTMTRPEMTIFLKKAKAIVTDEGGTLCHAANVAREFKIPTIVGMKIATKVLNDGDIVEVNANHGWVKILERAGNR